MKQAIEDQQVLGWILYDASCGFCRRWVPFWEDALQRRGFSIAALQTDWVRAKLQLSDAELIQDLRLLLADGSQIRGADVYRYATRRIWWAWPVYLFLSLPACAMPSTGVIEHSLQIASTFLRFADWPTGPDFTNKRIRMFRIAELTN